LPSHFDLEYQFRESCELPDGTIIYLDFERFFAPEMLFLERPQFPGAIIQKLVDRVVSQLSGDERQQLLCKNIVLTGGNASLSRFHQRLEQELKNSHPRYEDLHVSLNPDPHHAAFIGSSIFIESEEFKVESISKSDYMECGQSIWSRKL
jgi:actin-related protein